MKSNTKFSFQPKWSRTSRIICVLALVVASSYCTNEKDRTKVTQLSEDEAYLVDAYVQVAAARDLYSVNYLKSESLFTLLDSTIDTLRIANTIRELDRDPDRWLLVFTSIEKKRKNSFSQGRGSEQTR